MTIGERVKAARERKGFTQDELAHKLGYKSRSSINKIEKERDIPRSMIVKLAEILDVTPAYLMGWDEEKKDKSNISAIYKKSIRMIPVFESVSAGFGAYADDQILDYCPFIISSEKEAAETIAIRVSGDSMSPKIEDGDIIRVHKQESVDSGSIAVVLLDGEEGLVKKVVYGDDWIELHSINPYYPVRRFDGEEVLRLRVVGLVKGSFREI